MEFYNGLLNIKEKFYGIALRLKGYTRFQLKLGGNLSDDIDRLRLSRQVLGVNDILVGDANTGQN